MEPAFFRDRTAPGNAGPEESNPEGNVANQRLVRLAPAKINLHLSIVGRREDGYHRLETLMVKLNLADRLELALSSGGLRLDVRGADLPDDERNLVYRAADAFFKATGLKTGANVLLEKSIPVAAGLGGGSSDAAATLTGLNMLCGHPLGGDALMDLGLTLGADVPFFIQPAASAWALGIGEDLRPAPKMEKLWFLLVNPGWPLSTAEVYKNYNLELTTRHRNSIFSGLNESSFTIIRVLYNDLESVVLPKHPELERIKTMLLDAGALGALMSGSGPTIFGVFASRPLLDRARGRLEKEGNSHWNLLPTFTPPAASD